MAKAVFLDRDGVLIRDDGYPHRPEHLRILRGVPEAVGRLNRAGYKVIVVTNQAGVAKGRFGEGAVRKFNAMLAAALAGNRARIDAFYYCPHHPEGKVRRYRKACGCRKPEAGMLLLAAKEHGISLADSWMVGDRLKDVQAGKKAGCRTIKIGGGRDGADFAATSLLGAQRIIFREDAAHL